MDRTLCFDSNGNDITEYEFEEINNKCDFCSNHMKGDTLYESSSWDGGVGFDYIKNIEFCPLCGKELAEE